MSRTHMETDNQRQYHRIEYPRDVQPRLDLDRADGEPGGAFRVACDVVDCSERGVRVRLPVAVRLEIGAAITGTIRFSRGATVRISGTVVWAHGSEAAIRMERTGGLPFRIIMDEQRYLRTRFARSCG